MENQTPVPSGTKIGRGLGFVGSIIGSASWVLLVACKTNDIITVTTIGVVTALIIIIGLRWLENCRTARSVFQMVACLLLPLGITGLLAIYFRSSSWKGFSSEDLHQSITVNIAILAIASAIIIGQLVFRFCRKDTIPADLECNSAQK